MAAIYKEIRLEWKGQEYNITPRYRMIQQIEQRISLLTLLNRTVAGEPPLSQLADVLETALRFAGCEVTAEDLYAELYRNPDLQGVAAKLLFALMPDEDASGNDVPPSKGGKSKKGKSRKRSRGPTTTK